MGTAMKYIVATKNRGLVLSPDTMWNGGVDVEFEIHVRSDSDYVANIDDRRSISGGRVFLNGAPVFLRAQRRQIVTLSLFWNPQLGS